MPNTKFTPEKSGNSGQKLQTTVRLEPNTFARIDKIMLSIGVSRAEVIRRIIQVGLEEFRDEYI